MEDTYKNISNNCNKIEQVAISDLLDGRTFFIPSYQRGYRWTKTQIYDLCNDLLEYALKPKPVESPKAFYSLQPLIVRRAYHEINGEKTNVFEVIDGQQRLTSIYILYRALMRSLKITSSEELKEDVDATLYHIYYETRPYDYSFIENLGFTSIFNHEIKDIDIAHIVNAYNYIQNWLKGNSDYDPECAMSTWTMFSKAKFTPKVVADKLFKLLNNEKDSEEPEGNTQFLWYEIDASKDAIQEFLSENKGKIRLTDTEKIRALFMQRKKHDDIDNLNQLSIAKDWELIENTLHRNDFWSFISSDTEKEDGRISIVFQYIYDRDCLIKHYQGEDKLFRYYYNLFNNRSEESNIVLEEWNKVMEAFRMLQNWYQNPRLYNLVGLLTKETTVNLSIKDISDIYNAENVVTTEDFILSLKGKVCDVILDPIPIESNKENKDLEMKEGDRYISLFFDKPTDKKKIPGILRFLNVNALCQQIERMLADVDKPDEQKKASDMGRSNRDEQCTVYRFPFDALDVFGWDIEHIDSATSNSLTNPKEQEAWIAEAENALGTILLSDMDYSQQKLAWETAAGEKKEACMSNMLGIIKALIGEDDVEERKNWIGNLTLLDCGTNRMYKNKIFTKKRKIIQERINRGVFVPVCTQNIFNKTYPNCTKDNLKWDFNDKKSYHQYILQTIQDFKQKYSNKQIIEK